MILISNFRNLACVKFHQVNARKMRQLLQVQLMKQVHNLKALSNP